MRLFSILSAAILSANIATAEDQILMTIPLGHAKEVAEFDLCTKLDNQGGISGGIECGFVPVHPNAEKATRLGFLRALGKKDEIASLFDQQLSEYFAIDEWPDHGAGKPIVVIKPLPKICELILHYEGCDCDQNGLHCSDFLRGGEIPWPLILGGALAAYSNDLDTGSGFDVLFKARSLEVHREFMEQNPNRGWGHAIAGDGSGAGLLYWGQLKK